MVSPNAYDSMGDYYTAPGDKTQAIANYQKALSLIELPETRGKLEKLKREKLPGNEKMNRVPA